MNIGLCPIGLFRIQNQLQDQIDLINIRNEKFMKEEKPNGSRLERWSWVASILSFLLALLVWVFPFPIATVDTSLTFTPNRGWLIFRLGICFILVLLAISVSAFNVIRKKGKFSLQAEFRGDWLSAFFPYAYDAYAFILVSFSLLTPFVKPTEITPDESFVLIVSLFLGIGLMIWRLRKAAGGIDVSGKIRLETEKTVATVSIIWFATALVIVVFFGIMFWNLLK